MNGKTVFLTNDRFHRILAFAIVTTLLASGLYPQATYATPGSGVTAELLASGDMPEPIRVKFKGNQKVDLDVSRILTYRITILPGGVTGWHQHGGPHSILVVSGTLTYYEGDDPTCTGVDYHTGSAILDPGFDTHFVKNNGSEPVVTLVTQWLEEDGVFRIDVPAPENCAF
jgi:quercetin dioxygenase-like cupin family protein